MSEKTKTVYNRSACVNEQATLQECPRCRGFGGVSGDADTGVRCICNGHGRVWRTPRGWTWAPGQNRSKGKLY